MSIVDTFHLNTGPAGERTTYVVVNGHRLHWEVQIEVRKWASGRWGHGRGECLSMTLWGHPVATVDDPKWRERITDKKRWYDSAAKHAVERGEKTRDWHYDSVCKSLAADAYRPLLGEHVIEWCTDNVTRQYVALGPMPLSVAAALCDAKGQGVFIADKPAAEEISERFDYWCIHTDG